MFSYEFYKIAHLSFIALLITGFSLQFFGVKSKAFKIMTGVATLFVLVTGMGLMARLGIGHGTAWPVWIFVKYAIWLLIGVGSAIIVKRAPHLGSKAYVLMMALFVLAAITANLKY